MVDGSTGDIPIHVTNATAIGFDWIGFDRISFLQIGSEME